MDEGRYHDLQRLQAVIDNPNKSKYARQAADKAKKDIIRQMKDKKLVHLRERLIRAAQALDEHEEWKIANEIKDYMKKEKMGKYA